jgi:hypothetical protein
MATPSQHRFVPDHSGTPPQSGKVGVYFRSYEYISNQTTINHTRPTRGGTFLHHQIALENHCKAERLPFGDLRKHAPVQQTIHQNYHSTRNGRQKSYIIRLL